jgi:hypothetical protein
VSLGFSLIAEENLKKILFIFPRLDLELKGKCLESILSCADKIKNLFEEFIAIDINGLLRTRDDICQALTYAILNILVPNLTLVQVKSFLETAVNSFTPSMSERCRIAFYSLICRIEAVGDSLALDHNSMQSIRMSLLRGLSDSSDNIRNTLTDHINTTAMKDLNVFQRVEKTLG